MALRVLVLHGPNVQAFGEGRSLDVVNAQLEAKAQALGLELKVFHANGEAALLDELYAEREWADAAVVNPGSLAPVAFGLGDALASWGKPAMEVLLEHESKGRGKSALRQAVQKQLHGQGDTGYLKALELLAKAQPGDSAARLRAAVEATSENTVALDEVQRLARRTAPNRSESVPAKSLGRAGARGLEEARGSSGRGESNSGGASSPRRGEANTGGARSSGRAESGSGAASSAGLREASAGAASGAGRGESGSGAAPSVGRGDAASTKTIGRAEPKTAALRPATGPRKTIGRREEGSQLELATSQSARGQGLTRGEVKSRVLLRLSGKLQPEQLALWARSQWASLQSGGPVEEGRRDLLDEVLLMLAASAKASDDVLLSIAAKLDA